MHASPASPGDWHYVLSPDHAFEEMEAYAHPLCFIGHSHYPGIFERAGEDVRYTRDARLAIRADRRYLVNALRADFRLPGVPIRLMLRKGENPFADRKRRPTT